MSKQTAVDYLFEKLCGENGYVDTYYMDVVNKIQAIYEEAKAMEREQMGLPNCKPMDEQIISVTIIDPATGKVLGKRVKP